VSRAAIRTGIASFFGGSTYDDQAKIYRPTPLASAGLAGVRPYWTRQFKDEDYTTSLAPGSLMGAVMCVHLPGQQERRIAMGGPISGIKRDTSAIELWVFHLAVDPYPEAAQAHLDDLIDAIKTLIHGDRTLGGAVVEAGESSRGISTSTGLPVVEPSTRILQECVITFDADVYPFA
jgi:hypothetical protein